MKLEIKMFEFKGSPVYLKLWFLLMFVWASPGMVAVIFLSILAHELAHTFVANRLGYRVRRVYIDIFFGAAEIDLEYCSERDLIPIVAAGPLSNLALFFISLAWAGAFPAAGAFTTFLTEMATVNLILFIFNILPIYPMDGGRIARAFLMMKMRSDRAKAKKIGDWISLATSVLLLSFCAYNMYVLLGIFSIMFIFMALKELKYI